MDFEENELHIRRNLNYIKGEWFFGKTKSLSGNRIVPLADPAREILFKQRKKSVALPAKEGFENLIFRTCNGTLITCMDYDRTIKLIYIYIIRDVMFCMPDNFV